LTGKNILTFLKWVVVIVGITDNNVGIPKVGIIK